MTNPWRLLAVLALALAALAVALFLLRAPLARVVLSGALRDVGFENLAFSVKDISFDRLIVSGVSAGSDPEEPDVALSEIAVEFDLGALIAKRRVRSIALGPGSVTAQVTDAGVRIGGFLLPKAAEPRAPPFDRLALNDVSVMLTAPQGAIAATVEGAIDMKSGGEFAIEAKSDAFRTFGVALTDATAQLRLRLDDGGSLALSGALSSDVDAFARRADAMRISLDGEVSDWRAYLQGDRSALKGAAEMAASTPRPAQGTSEPGAVEAVALNGRARLEIGGGRILFDTVGEPLRVDGARGGALVEGLDSAPLYEAAGARRRVGVAVRLVESSLQGSARILAETDDEGGWRYSAGVLFDEQTIGAQRLGRTSASSFGTLKDARLAGALDLVTHVRDARVGRLLISDAPIDADLDYAVDLKEKKIVASGLDGACILFERARLALAEQDNEARLGKARLCGREAPVFVVSYGDPPQADVVGALDAERGTFRIGATRFVGAPPRLQFAARYQPLEKSTHVSGDIAGGRAVLNEALVFSDATGRFTAQLVQDALSGDVALDRVRVAQSAPAPLIAPFDANGVVRLADNVFRFDYAARTPRGAPLGKGSGAHNSATGKGKSRFDFESLAFAPRGLQPAALLPPLKGVVGSAVGAADGWAEFAWGKTDADKTSRGRLELADVSFTGPGRAVTRTEGVSAEIELSSLAPLATPGPQTVRIKKINMDALVLPDGEATFELPGDGTVRVASAEFPWYGGTIGAYDASAPLGGGETKLSLRAAGVDLKTMLEAVDIDGLSGEGAIEGVLPIVFADGKARIVDGSLSAVGPGVLRYTGRPAQAAAASNENARLAFEILRDLRFERLTAKLDGPLDGDLNFNVLFEGSSPVTIGAGREPVVSPVIYRISIEAPLLALLRQAQTTTDVKLQLERGREPN